MSLIKLFVRLNSSKSRKLNNSKSGFHLHLQVVVVSLINYLCCKFTQNKRDVVLLELRNRFLFLSWPTGIRLQCLCLFMHFFQQWVFLLLSRLRNRSTLFLNHKHCVRIDIFLHTCILHLAGIRCKAWSWSCWGGASSFGVSAYREHMSMCFRIYNVQTFQNFCTAQFSSCFRIIAWIKNVLQHSWNFSFSLL